MQRTRNWCCCCCASDTKSSCEFHVKWGCLFFALFTFPKITSEATVAVCSACFFRCCSTASLLQPQVLRGTFWTLSLSADLMLCGLSVVFSLSLSILPVCDYFACVTSNNAAMISSQPSTHTRPNLWLTSGSNQRSRRRCYPKPPMLCADTLRAQWVVNVGSACIGCKHYLPINVLLLLVNQIERGKRRIPPTTPLHSFTTNTVHRRQQLLCFFPLTSSDSLRVVAIKGHHSNAPEK